MLPQRRLLQQLSAASAFAAVTLGGTIDGTATTTITTDSSTTTTSGDSTVAPYTNTTTTVLHQSVSSSTPSTTFDDTVTVNGVSYSRTRTVSGAGGGTQDSTSALIETYTPGSPPTLLSSTTTGPVVTPTGTPAITAVAASGFAGDALNSSGAISFGSSLSTSGDVEEGGTVVATENSVTVTTSGTTYASYVGTATYNATTGDVSVTLPSAPTSLTTITSAGLTTTGSVSASTIFANVGGVAGAAAIDAGGGRITNLAAGVAPTDAVNVSQLNAAVATMTTDFFELARGLKKRSEAGTAVAVAMSGGVFLPNKRFNVTANIGTYKGESAISGQLGILVSDNVALNAGVATSFNSYGGTAARGGVTFGF